jgi:hypothetical protein
VISDEEIRIRIEKWDCINLKVSVQQRKQISEPKGKKIFTSYSSDKELISRVYKELQKLNTERTNNPIHKWTKEQTVLKKRSTNG